MMVETVSSGQNPKIKELLALQEKSRYRRERGLFVVEGRRELRHCIDAGFSIRTLFVCPEICPREEINDLIEAAKRSDGAKTDMAGTVAGVREEAGAGMTEKASGAGTVAGAREEAGAGITEKASGAGTIAGVREEAGAGMTEKASGAGTVAGARKEAGAGMTEKATGAGTVAGAREEAGAGRTEKAAGIRTVAGKGMAEMMGEGREMNVIEIPPALYSKVAYREGTEGVIAEVRWKQHGLDGIKLGKDPLIMVLERVEKPGNLGAVLRSADAAGADAVIICDPLTDIYNPNLIRSSIGAIFSRQVATASSEDTIKWLKNNNIKILTAQLQDSQWYYSTDMRTGVAIVMGTESTGLTDTWRRAADAHIRIPMLGQLDSLNVSVSAAILLYEAVRQRHSGEREEPGR